MTNQTDNDNNFPCAEEIIAQLPGHVYWKDLHGILRGCNTNTWSAFGLKSLHDYINKTDFDLFPENQAQQLVANDQLIMETETAQSVEEYSDVSDGTTALFLSHKAPLRNKHDHVVGMIGVSINITKAKQQEMVRLTLLENIISLMPGHVYWKDLQGNYMGCNKAQADTLGLKSEKEIIHKRPYQHLSFKMAERLRQIDAEVLQGNIITEEESGIRADGSTGIFLTKKTPLYDDNNNVVGLLGVSFDITDRKETEAALILAKKQAEAADKSKTEFIQNMNHDFVTALSSISGLTTLLIEGNISEPDRANYLNNIKKSSDTLNLLINDIIDFSRDTENKQVRQDIIDLSELTQTVKALVANNAEQKNLRLTISTTSKQHIISDRSRLTRILMNLLGNAIKFTDEGRVSVIVMLHQKSEHDALISFIVSDTGIGIPENKLKAIFGRFTRIDPAYRGHTSGAGLGLNIAQRFVKDLNGKIAVDSTPNKGTTFTIEIPCKIAQQAALDLWKKPSNNDDHARINASVLLVEDSLLIQTVTKRFLESLGCNVDLAENAKQALERINANHDLVLLDIGLPDHDGFYLTQKIRSVDDEKIKNIPIVAHTAHLEKEKKQMAIEAGMNDFLTKPTDKAILAKMLATFIK